MVKNIIETKYVIKKIKQYTEKRELNRGVEAVNTIQEYLCEAPSDIQLCRDYISIKVPDQKLTNVVAEKIQKLVYNRTGEHQILIPYPETSENNRC